MGWLSDMDRLQYPFDVARCRGVDLLLWTDKRVQVDRELVPSHPGLGCHIYSTVIWVEISFGYNAETPPEISKIQ
jgi:hypothetical protein